MSDTDAHTDAVALMASGHEMNSVWGMAMRTVFAALPILVWLTTIPLASAQEVTPPDVLTVSPTGVNLSDGSFMLNETDLSIGSLKLERFSTGGPSRDSTVMPFGYHSGTTFDIYVKEHSYVTPKNPTTTTYYRAIVHIGPSATSAYDMAFNVSPILVSPNSDDARDGILELSGNAYVYTDQNGTVYTFDGASYASQNIVSMVYANGRKLTFSTNSGNQTKLITSSDGYALVFQYNGSVITAACGFNLSRNYVSGATTCSGATLKTTYGYANGVLTSATNVLGATTAYAYSGTAGSSTSSSQAITCVQPPGYSTCKISNIYGASGSTGRRVTQQTLATGEVWNFVGGNPNTRDPDYQDEDGGTATSMIDPNNNITGLTFTKSSPYSVIDANNKTTQYRFSGAASYYQPSSAPMSQGKLLMQAILPEGNEFDATYAGDNFNLPGSRTLKAKPGSGLADRTEYYSYPSCASPNTRQNCAHPTAFVDVRGNQTDYVYTSFGSLQSEMKPAPTAGAARPLKLYTYVQKYAYIKNSGGSLVAAATPIWMPASETLCQTVAGGGSNSPVCDATAPRKQTTYEYAMDYTADNLLARGIVVTDLVTGVALRTCYGYDPLGRKISETKPRAGLTVCQ